MHAMKNVRYFLPFISVFATSFFVSVLGSESIPTRGNLVLFGIILFGFNLIFRLSFSRLKKKYGFTLVFFLNACLFLLFSLWLSCFRSYALSILSSLVIFGISSGAGQVLPLPGPSAPSSSSYDDDFGIDVLLESWPKSTETGTSVNQPEAGPVPPANPVAPRGDEAGPSNPVIHFPYQQDEVIGGDSLISIQQRLLAKKVSPSVEVIEWARFEAEDLFEVKVEIIRRMTPLDPEGDWERRGARALDNPRTATGEESLGGLHALLDDLNQRGVESQAFRYLKEKVFLKRTYVDEHSST